MRIEYFQGNTSLIPGSIALFDKQDTTGFFIIAKHVDQRTAATAYFAVPAKDIKLDKSGAQKPRRTIENMSRTEEPRVSDAMIAPKSGFILVANGKGPPIACAYNTSLPLYRSLTEHMNKELPKSPAWKAFKKLRGDDIDQDGEHVESLNEFNAYLKATNPLPADLPLSRFFNANAISEPVYQAVCKTETLGNLKKQAAVLGPEWPAVLSDIPLKKGQINIAKGFFEPLFARVEI